MICRRSQSDCSCDPLMLLPARGRRCEDARTASGCGWTLPRPASREALHRDRLADRRSDSRPAHRRRGYGCSPIRDRRGENLARLDRHAPSWRRPGCERVASLAIADQRRDQVQLLPEPRICVPTDRASCRRPCGGFSLGHLNACPSCRSVAREIPGRRELAELHADHVLVDRHRHELAAVIDAEGQTDEVGQYGRTTRPGLDRRARIGFLRVSAPS